MQCQDQEANNIIAKIQYIANKVTKENPEIRYGQALYNALFDINKELARKIVGTDCDPFYLNNKIPKFFQRILELD